MSNVATTDAAPVAEYVQYTRLQGKGMTGAVRAAVGVDRGASPVVLADALKGQARTAALARGASLERRALSLGIAQGDSRAYQMAFFTVASVANVTTCATADEVGKVNRAGWMEMRRDLVKALADLKAGTPREKAVQAALALWSDLQAAADAARAEQAVEKVSAQGGALTIEQAFEQAAA